MAQLQFQVLDTCMIKENTFFKAKDQWKVGFHARKIILKFLFQILVTFEFISNAVLHNQSLMILFK